MSAWMEVYCKIWEIAIKYGKGFLKNEASENVRILKTGQFTDRIMDQRKGMVK